MSNDLEGMIISLFAQGTSTRDIGAHMQKVYGLDVSAEMVTRITDKILPIAKEWQNGQLNELYPIIYLDGIVFNVNKDGHIIKKTAYLVFAITIEGKKDILGIWIGEAESSKFWMTVLADLQKPGSQRHSHRLGRWIERIRGGIRSTFPKTEIQKCIVHQSGTPHDSLITRTENLFAVI